MARYIQFSPYKALLALFGRDQPVRVSEPGRPKKEEPAGPYSSQTYQYFQEETRLAKDRFTLYDDYDSMDDDDIISSALNLMAEDATQVDASSNRTVWVVSKNSDVEAAGNKLLDEMRAEDTAFSIARGLAKYGDYFAAVHMAMDKQHRPVRVCNLGYRDPRSVCRVDDEFDRLKGFQMVSPGSDATTQTSESILNPWEIVHFRLVGREGEETRHYGTSLIRPSRKVYKRLVLMENAMIIYRMRRAPDRLLWKIYVGSSSPAEAAELVNEYRTQLRKKMLINPTTGEMSRELDPLSIDEDIFIPVGEGTNSSVEVMRGAAQVGHVLDIEYMRKRLFSCLRIPPDYMGFADASGALSAKSPLSDQDVQFARQEKRLQRALAMGYVMLIKIDMALRGIDPENTANEFKIRMCPVSFLDELQRAETAKVRATTIETLTGVGKVLGVDPQRWMAYVIRMSGVPEEVIGAAEMEAAANGSKLTETDRTVLRRLADDAGLRDLRERSIVHNEVSSLCYPLHFKIPPLEERAKKEPTDD